MVTRGTQTPAFAVTPHEPQSAHSCYLERVLGGLDIPSGHSSPREDAFSHRHGAFFHSGPCDPAACGDMGHTHEHFEVDETNRDGIATTVDACTQTRVEARTVLAAPSRSARRSRAAGGEPPLSPGGGGR